MLTNNLIGLLLSGSMYTYGVITQGDDTHVRVMQTPAILKECLIWGFAGAIGQVFIFFTISMFNSYLLTVITTTRKFFSVVYSNFRFGHKFDNT